MMVVVVVVVDEKIPYDRQSLCSRVGDDEKFALGGQVDETAYARYINPGIARPRSWDYWISPIELACHPREYPCAQIGGPN
jgi:hypothetical protein